MPVVFVAARVGADQHDVLLPPIRRISTEGLSEGEAGTINCDGSESEPVPNDCKG